MRIVYTSGTLRQIDQVLDYIELRNPQGAQRVTLRIRSIIDMLGQQPLAGRSTERPGQRRMLVSPYPYAIFYRVRADAVIIQRLRPTARRPLST